MPIPVPIPVPVPVPYHYGAWLSTVASCLSCEEVVMKTLAFLLALIWLVAIATTAEEHDGGEGVAADEEEAIEVRFVNEFPDTVRNHHHHHQQ